MTIVVSVSSWISGTRSGTLVLLSFPYHGEAECSSFSSCCCCGKCRCAAGRSTAELAASTTELAASTAELAASTAELTVSTAELAASAAGLSRRWWSAEPEPQAHVGR